MTANRAYALKKGQRFDVPTMGASLVVTRVAKSGEWADVKVQRGLMVWTKRQPLVDGWFSFPVRRVG